MNVKDLKALFGLEAIPWFELLSSALGLSLLASLAYGAGYPSESLLWFLKLIGVDASAGVAAVHGWFVDPMRKNVLTTTCGTLLALAGFAYARCHWKWLLSDETADKAGRNLHASRSNLLRKDYSVSPADKKASLEREEKAYSKTFREEADLRGWYTSRMVRLAGVAWLLAALIVEANGSMLEPWAILLGAVFVVVLVIMEIRKTDSGPILGIAGVGLFLGLTILVSLLALPAFIVARMTLPPLPKKSMQDKTEDSAG